MNWLAYIFLAFFISLGAWICWELYLLQLDREESIHRKQPASSKYTAFWKSLGIER